MSRLGVVAGVAVALGLVSAPARAGDRAAVRQVLDAQVAAIGAHAAGDFAATFAAHPFALLPGGYATSGAEAGAAADAAWWSPDLARAVVKAKVDAAVIGLAGDRAWITAEVTLSLRGAGERQATADRYRVTELLTREPAGWRAQAAHWSRPVRSNADAWSPAQVEGDASGPGGPSGAAAPGAAWAADPAELATHLRAGKDVIVLGSAPRERGVGAAGARMLTSWKAIGFELDWARAAGDGATWAWVAGRVSRQIPDRGELSDPRRDPYWVLLLLVKTGAAWEVVSVHYGQTMPGDAGG